MEEELPEQEELVNLNQEDIDTIDLDGDGIPDHLEVGDLDALIAATSTELDGDEA